MYNKGLFRLLAVGIVLCGMLPMRAWAKDGQRFMDILDTTEMYDAAYIDEHFVSSNDVDRIVGGIVTARVDEVLAPANFELVYSNKTVAVTNEFNLTPYVMNSISLVKGDKVNFDEYVARDTCILEARDDNRNYSVLLERSVNGVTNEAPVILDFHEIIAQGRFYCNIKTNLDGQVVVSQDKLPIIMRMEEPAKGIVICTLKSLDELPPMQLKEMIKWSR